MPSSDCPAELGIDRDGHLAIVEMRRPPHNYFDEAFLRQLADAFEALDRDPAVRAIVLCAQGQSFSAGAQFGGGQALPRAPDAHSTSPIYAQALRLFAGNTPIVAAVHGAAVGGGLGLALVADLRVSCAEARFSANFARLGISPGFGLTATLPRLIGAQQAAALFYTGRRIAGEQALAMGLVDELVPGPQVRERSMALALDIAVSSPQVVRSVREQLRQGLVDEVRAAMARESMQQYWQFDSEDFREGAQAMTERRAPRFQGR